MGKGKEKRVPGDDEQRLDPNLPRKDGPNVSQHGGIWFILVILGLLLMAVVAQFVAFD
jgi:hypothetical protein